MSNNLLQVVASDLRYLFEEWEQEIDDDSLRRTSPILRRLLVHKDLGKAWRQSGFYGEPEITTKTLKNIYKFTKRINLKKKHIRFASVGGALYRGVKVHGAFYVDLYLSDQQLELIRSLPPV